ncbi:MAG: phospho-N-acetylmuramoyl-pentapeptide-transferase [Christensenellales bacterium]|jgi:phospho-N-acetylmuramoyl-pentapeptide-transferase
MTLPLLAIIIAFVLSMAISPPVIRLMTRLKAGQPISKYVDLHTAKSGRPTMGGIIFVLPVVIITMLLGGEGITIGKYAAIVVLGYSIVGFLDDYIKVRFKDNKGLKAYQKIIGQLAIALIISIYAYRNNYINTDISVPFSKATVELGAFYIVFVIFVFIASTNGVNLTDGLDGLSSIVSIVYFLAFLIIIYFGIKESEYYGNVMLNREYRSLAVFTAAFAGSLIAFFWFNSAPGKIIMGDTGALAIGGGVAAVGVFSNRPVLIVIIGIMFVISCVSDIIQVLYFKATGGKRIFLMAPFHHHLEYKGVKEWKIVSYYFVITLIMSVIAVISVM